MPISREERDAWCILLGDTQERLNLIHAEADAMRSRLEAEGRGSTARWPSVSDDDDEFEDCTPMTPPMTPPMSSSSGLSNAKVSENGFSIVKVQRRENTPFRNTPPSIFEPSKPRIRRVSSRVHRRTRRHPEGPISQRITRSRASKTVVFYELADDAKTSRRVYFRTKKKSI